MDEAKAFLGRGFSFPPRIDPSNGKFVMVESEDDIKEAVYIILMTRLRERAMLPDFGCNMHDYVFDIPDVEMKQKLARDIKDALMKYEPRIINVLVDAEMDRSNPGKLNLSIEYTVRATNNPYNLVFPYYLEEGIGEL